MDILSWDGTLSSGDFRLAACAFMQKWKSVMSAFPPWSWVPCPKQPWGASASHDVEGYLSLENIILSCYAQEEHDEISCPQKEETSCSEKEELIDIATLSNCSKVPYYDLHIIYSASYRVPVLFFRAYYSDGEPLGFNAIEKDLPAHSAKALLDSKWTFITQEEHPYLNRPWFKLHPCGTSEWMKLLFHVDVSVAKNGVTIELYLLSWLSVVGQVVGLRIPLEMLNQP
ncbi:ubiquitin-like-conjugating enzyme ATG10 isoform X3 [Corylus avellana]|uniref:ubiquitin-like-conjugating enzyme ATG10 isoform X3 n=1 Tax=Corylus avellana TaxID=13451 RepID=UPI00286C906D|nr:ubiquitin-like-conjugating enzyme ATG10 isoform X3 [Corylus avellana]